MSDISTLLLNADNLDWVKGLEASIIEKGDVVPEKEWVPFLSAEGIEDIAQGRYSATLDDAIIHTEVGGDRVIRIRDASGVILFEGQARWEAEQAMWREMGIVED